LSLKKSIPRSDRWLQAGEFMALREAATHDLAVVHSRQQMPARTEERRDDPKDRQESPGVPTSYAEGVVLFMRSLTKE
jgi:hypothetical protein